VIRYCTAVRHDISFFSISSITESGVEAPALIPTDSQAKKADGISSALSANEHGLPLSFAIAKKRRVFADPLQPAITTAHTVC